MTYDHMAINHKWQFGRAKFMSRSWSFFLLVLYSQKNFEFYQSFSLYPSMKLTEFIMVLIVILVLIIIEYSTVKYIRVINHLCQG